MESKATIYFEDPFWVGVFERSAENGYALVRFVFGSEPSEAQLLQFARTDYARLSFGALQPLEEKEAAPELGFKRRLREANKQMRQTGIGTRSQQALQAELERHKQEREQVSQAQKEALEEEKFHQRQLRKKEKHKGH